MGHDKQEGADNRSLRGKLLHLFCLCLFGLLGLGLILYPVVSNSLYDARQDGAIQQYETQMRSSQSDAERLAALEAARAYNRQLSTGILSLHDPFLSPTVMDENGEQRSLLDVTGTGVIATLDIPSLSLTLPVYYGTEPETLEHGIGLLEISSLPVGGENTHSVLCGHSGLSTAKLFSDLELMREGDRFTLNVLGEVLTYQVDRIVTVLPEDFSQLEIEQGRDYCTLLTCTPYGVNTHRLLVRGTRIPTPTEPVQTATEEQTPVQSVWMREYLRSVSIGMAAVLVGTVAVLIVRAVRRRMP